MFASSPQCFSAPVESGACPIFTLCSAVDFCLFVCLGFLALRIFCPFAFLFVAVTFAVVVYGYGE